MRKQLKFILVGFFGSDYDFVIYIIKLYAEKW